MNNELLELVKNNPELPVLAWVNAELCGDGFGYWLGKFKGASIKEYAEVEPFGYNDMNMVFKDDTEDYYDYLINSEPYKKMTDYDANKQVTHLINNLDYKKAIFVYVDMP